MSQHFTIFATIHFQIFFFLHFVPFRIFSTRRPPRMKPSFKKWPRASNPGLRWLLCISKSLGRLFYAANEWNQDSCTRAIKLIHFVANQSRVRCKTDLKSPSNRQRWKHSSRAHGSRSWGHGFECRKMLPFFNLLLLFIFCVIWLSLISSPKEVHLYTYDVQKAT